MKFSSYDTRALAFHSTFLRVSHIFQLLFTLRPHFYSLFFYTFVNTSSSNCSFFFVTFIHFLPTFIHPPFTLLLTLPLYCYSHIPATFILFQHSYSLFLLYFHKLFFFIFIFSLIHSSIIIHSSSPLLFIFPTFIHSPSPIPLPPPPTFTFE